MESFRLIISNLLSDAQLAARPYRELENPNSFQYKILDAKQLALKVTANSLYGQLGAPVSAIYKKEIAACTTSTGQEMLTLAKKYDEEQLPWIINGLKEAYKSEDDDKVNKILDLELKARTNEKFITKLK